MKMAVADVGKVLASVAKVCECGNSVVFDKDGSYVEYKNTGHNTRIDNRSGVYVMDILVPTEDKEEEDKEQGENVTPGKKKFTTGFMGACTK